MSDLHFRTATELAAMIRDRAISSVELVDHFLARIAAKDGAINAVVTLDAERARARAEAADQALARGASWGALHGLPITVKDTFETAGVRTTAGFPPFSDHVPASNAVSVERLLGAGAILLGKTNTPPMASDWQSYNPIFGTTNNPWDVARTPGGSSGGSAAAMAAGLSALELGSDIAGSIRVPAGWCGIYGHKPTFGIVPTRGHIPGPPGALSQVDLSVMGPMARGAADLDLGLRLLAGPLPDRAKAWRFALPAPRRERLDDYRVAAWLDDAEYGLDEEVREVLDAAIAALRGAGVAVDEQARPDFSLAESLDVYMRLVWPIMMAGDPAGFDAMVRLVEAAAENTPRMRVARAATLRHRDWIIADEHREHLRAKLAAFFERFDVLLLPINQVPAIPHDHSEPQNARVVTINGAKRSYLDLLPWIGIATMTLHPATAAPVGRTRGGLPVGIQIVAPYLEDRTSIDFAERLGEVTGRFVAPPG